MTDENVQVINKPAFLEVSDGEVLIPIATNIPIELSPASPVLPMTPTMKHLPLNDTTYFQRQIDLLRQELEKNVIANNDFKNFFNRKLADEREHKNDEAEILYGRIRMLAKENQCLKNEIKHQQAVIEMLITNEKCADEWKAVKIKSKNNTNIASPSSVSPKNPSPVNLQNRFDNLAVIEVNQIEIHEYQYHTPTNHHRCCEITNTKSKSRAEKIIYTVFATIRPNINRSDHFITPFVEEDRPVIIIIHLGSNGIRHNAINNFDAKGISKRIIDIGKKCLLYVKEVIISSILIKRQFKLTRTIKNDECRRNKCNFISNDNITNEYLRKDGLHLNNDGTYMFARKHSLTFKWFYF